MVNVQTIMQADLLEASSCGNLKPVGLFSPVYAMDSHFIKLMHADDAYNHCMNQKILKALGVRTVETHAFPISEKTFETLGHDFQNYGSKTYGQVKKKPYALAMTMAFGKAYHQYTDDLDAQDKDNLKKKISPPLLVSGVLGAAYDLTQANFFVSFSGTTVIDYHDGLSCKGRRSKPKTVQQVYDTYLSHPECPQFHMTFNMKKLVRLATQAKNNFLNVTQSSTCELKKFRPVIIERHAQLLDVLKA